MGCHCGPSVASCVICGEEEEKMKPLNVRGGRGGGGGEGWGGGGGGGGGSACLSVNTCYLRGEIVWKYCFSQVFAAQPPKQDPRI